MKRFTKILACAVCAATVGTGTMFARGRGGFDRNRDVKGFAGRGFVVGTESGTTVSRPSLLIGQVSSVDEKNGTLKIADVDGKETVVAVSPFTRIHLNDSKDAKTIADIKKNDWVMYSLYNTETEKKLASRIIVKNN